eukprot:5554557-Karenia_brevis.AAC.1
MATQTFECDGPQRGHVNVLAVCWPQHDQFRRAVHVCTTIFGESHASCTVVCECFGQMLQYCTVLQQARQMWRQGLGPYRDQMGAAVAVRFSIKCDGKGVGDQMK